MKIKSTLIPAFLLIWQTVMEGQTAFLDSTFTWSERGFYGPSGASETSKYKFDQTPIYYNGKAYFEIFRSDSENGGNWEQTSIAIRHEGAKLYRGNPNGEELLLDFSLGTNDTFTLSNGGEMVVISIDSITLENGAKRKRLELNCESWGDYPIYWIEGVGSSTGLANYEFTCLLDVGAILLCLWENDTILYHNMDYDSCWYQPTSTIEFEKNNISFFPNPLKDQLIIEDPDLNMTQVYIYDLRGQSIYSGNEHEIPTTDFPTGMYILSIHLKNGLRISERIIKL